MIAFAHIRAVFTESSGTYGAPRVYAELKEVGLEIGRLRTARLMQDNSLKGGRKRALSGPRTARIIIPLPVSMSSRISPAEARINNWGVDIHYVWTTEGWLYLAIVLDVFSGRIVDLSVSIWMNKDLAMEPCNGLLPCAGHSPA